MKHLFSCLLRFQIVISVVFISLQAQAANKTTVADTTRILVKTHLGQLAGMHEKGVCVWRGIPYAQAPVGELRYKAPVPIQKWEGVKDATAFGPVAPQAENSFIEDAEKSEDCLYLNVWSPAADGKKRPVMFWVHGGGFVVGSGSSGLYNGATLAKNGDVVVVTINYRLGPLGFLYFDNNNTGFENNLGIRDQIAALQWVKQNIAAFGGDPETVTIFGESAGGTSVQTLLACPSAKGLFKRVIAESGPAAILWQPETARWVTEKFLELVHVPADSLHLLKQVPLDSILAVEEELLNYMISESANKVFSPTIDGQLLTTDISACLSPAQSGNIDLLLGTNKDESTMFASRRLKMAPRTAEQLDKEFFPAYSATERQQIISGYPAYPKKRAILDMVTDAVFRVPAIRVAECQSRHANVYMYRFEWSSFLLNVSGLRTFHGLEIPFVFGNTGGRLGKILKVISTKKLVTKLSGEMQQAWVNFARYGNPNGAQAGPWQPYTTQNRVNMIFDKPSRIETDPDKIAREAWEGIPYRQLLPVPLNAEHTQKPQSNNR